MIIRQAHMVIESKPDGLVKLEAREMEKSVKIISDPESYAAKVTVLSPDKARDFGRRLIRLANLVERNMRQAEIVK